MFVGSRFWFVGVLVVMILWIGLYRFRWWYWFCVSMVLCVVGVMNVIVVKVWWLIFVYYLVWNCFSWSGWCFVFLG